MDAEGIVNVIVTSMRPQGLVSKYRWLKPDCVSWETIGKLGKGKQWVWVS